MEHKHKEEEGESIREETKDGQRSSQVWKVENDDEEDYDDDNNCKDKYINCSGWTGEGCQNLQA